MYNSELDGINAGIEAIRKREGLHEDEDWPIGEGPDDYMELNEQFSQVMVAKFEETLKTRSQCHQNNVAEWSC